MKSRCLLLALAMQLGLAGEPCIADPSSGPIEVECGGSFQPRVDSVSGTASEILSRLINPNSGLPWLVPTAPGMADATIVGHRFCEASDIGLRAQCEAAARQDAVDNAVANCRRSALAKGDNDSLYRCKIESCPSGSVGCHKLSTDTDCSVAVPQLQCRCGVRRVLEQPYASASTYACSCDCTCTASGTADVQCTSCDGTCALASEGSLCSGNEEGKVVLSIGFDS